MEYTESSIEWNIQNGMYITCRMEYTESVSDAWRIDRMEPPMCVPRVRHDMSRMRKPLGNDICVYLSLSIYIYLYIERER